MSWKKAFEEVMEDSRMFLMSVYPIWNAHIYLVDLVVGHHVTGGWPF